MSELPQPRADSPQQNVLSTAASAVAALPATGSAKFLFEPPLPSCQNSFFCRKLTLNLLLLKAAARDPTCAVPACAVPTRAVPVRALRYKSSYPGLIPAHG
ncbi:unnamed protein product [Lampetra planeri]